MAKVPTPKKVRKARPTAALKPKPKVTARGASHPVLKMQKAFIDATLRAARCNLRFTREIVTAASLSVDELCNELDLPLHSGNTIRGEQDEKLSLIPFLR